MADAQDAVVAPPQPIRALSRSSCVPLRKTSGRETESGFSDFLSDGSNSSEEEDEDDADTRVLVRMQQQADDRTYVDTSFRMERPPEDCSAVASDQDRENRSFRLNLTRPRRLDSTADENLSTAERYSGPRRFVTEFAERATVVAVERDTTNEQGQSSLERDHSFTDSCAADVPVANTSEKCDAVRKSLSSRTSSKNIRRSAGDDSFCSDRPSFTDAHSFAAANFTYARSNNAERQEEANASPHDSLASRPPSFSADDDSFWDSGRPSFTDAHSFTGDSFSDHSFVYRPSLPADENGLSASNYQVSGSSVGMELPQQEGSPTKVSPAEAAFDTGNNDGGKSLISSPTPSSFIQHDDIVVANPSGIDSSFRMDHGDTPSEDDSFSSVFTDSYAGLPPPDLEKNKISTVHKDATGIQDPVASPVANDSFVSALHGNSVIVAPQQLRDEYISNNTSSGNLSLDEVTPRTSRQAHASTVDVSTILPLSRQSSASSTASSTRGLATQHRRMTATRESWRVSSLDFQESAHAFDEELGPLAGLPLSPRVSAAGSDQIYRLTSAFEERSSVASAPSDASSFQSHANFFVDDVQQGSFSTVRSFSLSSQPSASDDSFSNVAILGDDDRDENERRSSDLISQNVGSPRSSNIVEAYPAVTETLDHSYSNLVDSGIGLDRSYSSLVGLQNAYPTNASRDSTGGSSLGTSLGSSLSSSAISQSSDSSEDMSFVSFNVAKPPLQLSVLQQQDASYLTPPPAPGNYGREKSTGKPEKILFRSMVLSCGNDNELIPSSVVSSAYSNEAASFPSSAALLAAIKTRDTRTNTRSEEIEAGDVALGALPPLAPPLKINIVPRGRGSISNSCASASSSARSSSSISASPLALSSIARSSVASSTGTADRLDFTGVYRGSVNSLENSRNNGIFNASAPHEFEGKQEISIQGAQNEFKNKFEVSSVRLERSISDSRVLQRESQLKVEEFFRRTYRKYSGVVDERISSRWTNRTTRARTTVIQCVDAVEEEPRRIGFNDGNVAKIIDLKNLCTGRKDPASRFQDDAPLISKFEDELSKHRNMAMTSMTTSSGTTATTLRSGASDSIPRPHNYVLSPRETNSQQRRSEQETKFVPAQALGESHFSVSPDPSGDNISWFGAIGGRRVENVSLTPTLPRLSASGSSALSPAGFVASSLTPNGFGGSGMGKSSTSFADTASGFMWKAGSAFNGLKISGADTPFGVKDSQVSLTQRPTLADRVQTLSASLTSTLRRFLHGKGNQQHDAITSPQSQCLAPAALPRDYDHNSFYETPFKVPGLNKRLQQRQKSANMTCDPAWIRLWLILAVCALLGLSLGAILVRVVIYKANVFNLSANEVRANQETNDALIFSPYVQWLLLPGKIFLRVWRAVSVPLLVCYVITAATELVGCGEKSGLILNFRSIAYALFLAALSAAEGVLAMWMTHKFGWFRQSESAISGSASKLSDDLGVTPLPEGAVGLVCASDGEYLQQLGHDIFACSNASLVLPLFKEISTNTLGLGGSGAGVFALKEATGLLATPTPSFPYYPASLGSANDVTSSLVSELAPDSLTSMISGGENEGIAPLGGLVSLGLVLGYVCGKRILWLRRCSQAAMFESVRRSGPSSPSGEPDNAHHYIVGCLMELLLALECLVGFIERYLAPVGFFSLMLGNVTLHHRAWRSFVSPMTSLIFGVLILLVVHAVVILPLVLVSSNRRQKLLPTAKAFLPTFLFVFTTNSVDLSAPVSMQCYGRAHTVTRSGAQLATGVIAALVRNARALYLPLMLLWLLETSSSEEFVLRSSDYFSVGCVSLVSCFCGGDNRLTLAMVRTLWTIFVHEQSMPPTLSLLVACDVVLSRVASVVTVVDHLVLTLLVAEHWGETVVPSPNNCDNRDDGAASSALLSPVEL